MRNRRKYESPKLAGFGSVRNITGGSGGNGADFVGEKLVHDQSGA